LLLLTLAALAVAWTAPQSAGDLRPSPDAVEYGLGAADLAAGTAPRVRIGDLAVPSRYPFGFPLLAAPVVRLAAGTGEPRPQDAVLACALAGAVLTWAVVVTGARAYGGRTRWLVGGAGGALTVISPFFAQYAHLVMAEVPAAAIVASLALLLVSLAGGVARTRRGGAPTAAAAARWGAGAGLLLALAVTVRLSNLHLLGAAAAGAAAGVWGVPRRVWAGMGAGLGAGLVAGLLPLLLANWVTFGAPLSTGYHLWTPEWAGGERPQFALRYALDRPALPASAVQGNLEHLGRAWLGLPAAGDGGVPVGSPLHATAAGFVAAGAAIGLVRAARAGRAGRTLGAFVAAGSLGALLSYGTYYYQDVRYLAPWAPMWLLLAAAGWLWPLGGPSGRRAPLRAASRTSLGRAVLAVGGTAILVYALLPLPETLRSAPLWQAAFARRPPAESPRLAQMAALARDLPADAWLISAIDGPLLQYHVLRRSERRYVPLARGLEFVDKPPFRGVPAADELTVLLAARVATGRRDAVVIDRWSLEFAEGLPDYRRALEGVIAGLELVPGGAGAPPAPDYYALRPSTPDGPLGAYALRDGDAVRGSAGAVYVLEGGRRRHVPDLATFLARGLRWESVRRLPDAVLATVPEGLPLSG
jgi:hypothetical protein